jgi:histidyl-tRNA synthetase
MSKGPQRVRGTQDIFGEEADRFQAVVAAFERVRRLYAFRRVEMPVFEATEVFSRIGETTDIVSKEMYTFQDKGDEWITLRPEFTAGLCRAFISGGWQRLAPVRVATDGPVFRYERPQLGRYRQFHQIDVEILGDQQPTADVELLHMADQLLRTLRIKGVRLQINTLGDVESRERWRAGLLRYFKEHADNLSSESRDRLLKNPLRILDSKSPEDRAVVARAPGITSYLTHEAADFFAEVQSGLRASGIRFDINPNLVRGLDYYRHTAFEFVTDRLGAQGTVLAGGRYDGLIKSLGGPDTPGVGWAAGIERLMMLLPERPPLRSATLVVESEERWLKQLGRQALGKLRRTGMPSQLIDDGSVRKRFDRALKTQADYLLVFLETSSPTAPGKLRIKRRVSDPTHSRSRIVVSLGKMLCDRYGVNREELDEASRRGGEVLLIPDSER